MDGAALRAQFAAALKAGDTVEAMRLFADVAAIAEQYAAAAERATERKRRAAERQSRYRARHADARVTSPAHNADVSVTSRERDGDARVTSPERHGDVTPPPCPPPSRPPTPTHSPSPLIPLPASTPTTAREALAEFLDTLPDDRRGAMTRTFVGWTEGLGTPQGRAFGWDEIATGVTEARAAGITDYSPRLLAAFVAKTRQRQRSPELEPVAPRRPAPTSFLDV